LEYLAVLKLKQDMKGLSFALYGLPRWQNIVGKSIAKSLGRNYVRMSLGGVHDEQKSADIVKPTSVQCRKNLHKHQKSKSSKPGLCAG